MMKNEKPGGHGERGVAVGTLDMAMWDAAAKIANLTLHRFLSERLSVSSKSPDTQVYAAGGYYYPSEDVSRFADEIRRLQDRGYTRFKIKIGAAPLAQDLLDRYGGLRRDRDILVFDPVHCYGLTGYLRIVERLESLGWPRSAFWPHGGHLFCLHLVTALGLGGAEVNPQPFCGLADAATVENGRTAAPDAPGIGFELKQELWRLFRGLIQKDG
jgi:L-alanine-DL-glutamate epimerase-like enolase superfamily enzyme